MSVFDMEGATPAEERELLKRIPEWADSIITIRWIKERCRQAVHVERPISPRPRKIKG